MSAVISLSVTESFSSCFPNHTCGEGSALRVHSFFYKINNRQNKIINNTNNNNAKFSQRVNPVMVTWLTRKIV